jgi:hypothetical protein
MMHEDLDEAIRVRRPGRSPLNLCLWHLVDKIRCLIPAPSVAIDPAVMRRRR